MDDNKTKVGVFLCEDNLISRNLIFKLLSEKEKELGITIVGLEDCVPELQGMKPDVVILDDDLLCGELLSDLVVDTLSEVYGVDLHKEIVDIPKALDYTELVPKEKKPSKQKTGCFWRDKQANKRFNRR